LSTAVAVAAAAALVPSALASERPRQVLRDGGLALIPAQYQDLASSPRVWNVPADKVDPRPKEVVIAGAVMKSVRPGFFEFKGDA